MVKFLAGVLVMVASSSAYASLTTFQTYTGANYGVSTSGVGFSGNSGTILTSVPTGATLVAAYLYTGISQTTSAQTATLNGVNVPFGAVVANGSFLASQRADVTSIVASALAAAGGPSATPFGLAVTEGNTTFQDGEELVTVYKFATGSNNTVALLDGFASVSGDTASVTLAAPSTAATAIQMMIGDNFSCCGQTSSISVNGTTITNNAGNNDDCVTPATPVNGCLITVGTNLNNGDPAVSDPFSPLLPSYADDHERYNLSPYIALGSTTINIRTVNPSGDDNIFSAVFKISGDAVVVSGTPEPSTWLMLGTGFLGLGVARFRRKNN